jgi:hypothetical protein
MIFNGSDLGCTDPSACCLGERRGQKKTGEKLTEYQLKSIVMMEKMTFRY